MRTETNPGAINDWLRVGNPGTRIAYHEGNLVAARERDLALNKAAYGLYRAAQEGRVFLTQYKLSKGRYIYFATKRKKQ